MGTQNKRNNEFDDSFLPPGQRLECLSCPTRGTCKAAYTVFKQGLTCTGKKEEEEHEEEEKEQE